MTVFPTLTPSSRVFTLGDYSHAPLRSMGGTQTQVRHSNVVVGAGIELQFIGRSEADMLSIRTHYITSRGTFNVFTLPSALWIGTTDPTPPSYTWRYTEMPRVSEDGNGHYDIAVKLEMMPPDPSGSIANTQDVVVVVPRSAITVQALAPIVGVPGVISVPTASVSIQGLAPTVPLSYVTVPVTSVLVQGLAPEIATDAAISVPLASIIMQGIAPTIENGSNNLPIAATYSQRSVYSSNTAATQPGMTNGVSAETLQTGTSLHEFGAELAWVQMDFGSTTSFGIVYVGCDFASTLAGGWNKSYAENADIIGSNDLSSWTVLANTGTFTQGIQSYSTPGASYRYVRVRRSGYLAITEFYAATG